jgi:hypothetical protein
LAPVNRMRVPPDVGMVVNVPGPDTAAREVMDGAAYDVVTDASDSALLWSPTTTNQR